MEEAAHLPALGVVKRLLNDTAVARQVLYLLPAHQRQRRLQRRIRGHACACRDRAVCRRSPHSQLALDVVHAYSSALCRSLGVLNVHSMLTPRMETMLACWNVRSGPKRNQFRIYLLHAARAGHHSATTLPHTTTGKSVCLRH